MKSLPIALLLFAVLATGFIVVGNRKSGHESRKPAAIAALSSEETPASPASRALPTSPPDLAQKMRRFNQERMEALRQRAEELAAHQPGCRCVSHLGQ
jgi:hypothetical protein